MGERNYRERAELLESKRIWQLIIHSSDSGPHVEPQNKQCPLNASSSLWMRFNHCKWHSAQITNNELALALSNWQKSLQTQSPSQWIDDTKWTKPFISAISCQMTRWMYRLGRQGSRPATFKQTEDERDKGRQASQQPFPHNGSIDRTQLIAAAAQALRSNHSLCGVATESFLSLSKC